MRKSKISDVDIDAMLGMLTDGLTYREVGEALGVPASTVSQVVANLKKEESSLLAYSKVQHLDLLGVQQRLLAGVTDEKIAEAPLQAIAAAFSAFKKGEQLATGRPTEITGLMGYLMHLEKEDRETVESNFDTAEDVIDVPVGDVASGTANSTQL